LENRGTQAQNNVVLANAALAISCYYPEKSLPDCLEVARESLIGKRALGVFNKLLNR